MESDLEKKTFPENAALLKLRAYGKTLIKKENFIPLENFFKNSEVSNLQLSPNGKYLAYLKPFEKRMNIHVCKLNDPETEKRITNQISRDITSFGWKENDTLIFVKDFGGDENFHIFRVFASGEGEKDLTPFKETRAAIIDFLDDISEETVLIQTNQRDQSLFDAYRLNIKTGNIQMIGENPGHFTGWMTDHKGQLRVAVSIEGTDSSIYYRDTEEDKFQKITTTGFKDTLTPLMFSLDNQNLYVLSDLNEDKKAIELFNPKEKKTLSTLFNHPEVDASGLSYSKKRKTLLAAYYTTWKENKHFFNTEFRQIIQDLELKIPTKEINVISKNREENLFVIFAYSDKSPGKYYLYDVETKKLENLIDPYPWLKEEDMSEMKPISYIARDGLKIHGYLTLPKQSSGKNLPLVVNPHGGPWWRDSWRYNPMVQFMTNRGYAVFQMNFRGSTGYGKNFWTAGFKQWGKKMQDDITDGIQYLIQEGIVNKDKIAIVGGSYGGYAVLAGLAFTPDLYACGVDFVGVSNIFTLLKSIPPYWKPILKQFYEKIGHPEKDKELLEEVSPFFHADKIKAPLFVLQGANDPRVKKAESDQIVQALENRGVEVPYLIKANEGHGFRNEENRLEFYRLLEAFLDKHLK